MILRGSWSLKFCDAVISATVGILGNAYKFFILEPAFFRVLCKDTFLLIVSSLDRLRLRAGERIFLGDAGHIY